MSDALIHRPGQLNQRGPQAFYSEFRIDPGTQRLFEDAFPTDLPDGVCEVSNANLAKDQETFMKEFKDACRWDIDLRGSKVKTFCLIPRHGDM